MHDIILFLLLLSLNVEKEKIEKIENKKDLNKRREKRKKQVYHP